MENNKIEIFGVSKSNIASLKDILGGDIHVVQNKPDTRTGIELLSAAFVIGVLKVSPPLIKAITDFLSEIRKSKHVSFKVSSKDGSKIIEGTVSKETLNELKEELEKFIGEK